jgi:ribosomal-protein-alanine N-acetyltransferase
MHLPISEHYYISDIVSDDKEAYIEHFREKQIYDQTVNMPFPYTSADADKWLEHNDEATRAAGERSVNWAIRRSTDHYLVGGIGYYQLKAGDDHSGELAYFLAKPYWGYGIMSVAVGLIVDFSFYEFQLKRISANIFEFNQASRRILEKTGFQREGLMRRFYCKGGQTFDGVLYSILPEDRQKVLESSAMNLSL